MNPTSNTARLVLSRSRRRSRARGAALVEAAVAIPVMLVFLGLTMWIHNSYDEKLASQTSTRAQVLYYGSHNCEDAAPEEMSAQLGTKSSGTGASKSSQDGDPGGGNDDAKGGSAKLGGDTQAGLKRSWNLANTHRDTTVGGSAVQDRERVSFSVPIAANSEVACNEKRYDSSWTAVFGYIGGFLRSGGGIIN